jgi:hypothetical protein
MDLMVATDLDQVQQIVDRFNPERPRSRWEEPMSVDYQKYLVVIAYLGPKPYSGFQVTIDRMAQIGRTVHVTISTVEPSIGSAVVVFPLHAVLVKRSELRGRGNLTFQMWKGDQLLLTRSHFVP